MIALGAVLFLAGAAIGVATLAPMFGWPPSAGATSGLNPLSPAIGASGGPSMPDGKAIALNPSLITDGPVNGVAFEMEVPALKYRATVFEGVSTAELERGPGHYPESAWPGHSGNVAIAAHNVYWLSFSRLRPGDQVIVRTRLAMFTYEITGSRVVSPNDRSPLEQTPEHTLTLTTCYPLWAGAYATQRLIFTGREIGGVS